MSFRWRIYYGDGSTYDNRNGSPWGAPSSNVQVIVNTDPEHGWAVERASDYYWYMPEIDRWYSGDIFGLWDYLSQPGHRKVIFGRLILLSEYRAILGAVMIDPEIPKKTGWQSTEYLHGVAEL